MFALWCVEDEAPKMRQGMAFLMRTSPLHEETIRLLVSEAPPNEEACKLAKEEKEGGQRTHLTLPLQNLRSLPRSQRRSLGHSRCRLRRYTSQSTLSRTPVLTQL